MKYRFKLKSPYCSECGKEFMQEDKVYKATGEQEYYCAECYGRLLANDRELCKKKKLRTYVYIKKHCYTTINYNNVKALKDCCFQAAYSECMIPYIRTIKPKSMSVCDFVKELGEHYDILLEKHKDSVNLLFERSRVLPARDFLNKTTDFKKYFELMLEINNDKPIRCLASPDDMSVLGLTNCSEPITSSDLALCLHDWSVVDCLGFNTMREILSDEQEDIVNEESIEEEPKREEKPDTNKRDEDFIKPSELFEFCRKRVQGQDDELKKALYLIYHYLELASNGEDFVADNWILTAPSGAGKTEFYRTIKDFFKQKKIPIPVVQVDLSNITETGFKGDDANTIVSRIVAERPTSNKQYAICFLDEADKKCQPSYASRGGNINAAVQGNLLTLIEGTTVNVEVFDREVAYDTTKTMFVLMGAFEDIREQKSKDSVKTLGFGSTSESTSPVDFYEDVTIEEIIDYGMIYELAGRMQRVINFHRLSRKDMLDLLFDKTEEISKSRGIGITLSPKAANRLLELAYGPMGLRTPLNIIKELSDNAVAEVFFSRGIDYEHEMVLITSESSAKIVRTKSSRNDCEAEE